MSVHELEVDVGGGADTHMLNVKESFLLVKIGSFNHANIWSPKLQYSTRMISPCIHTTST